MLGQRFFAKGKKPLQTPQAQGFGITPPSVSFGYGSVPQPNSGEVVVQQPYVVQPMVMAPQVSSVQPVVMPIPQQVMPSAPMPTSPNQGMPGMPAPVGATPGVLDTNIDPAKRNSMDILTHLSQRSSQALFKAANKAGQLRMPYIDTEHVLYGLLFDSQFFNFLKELAVDPVALQRDIEGHFNRGNFEGQPQFSPRVKHVLELAYQVVQQDKEKFVSPEYLAIGLLQEGEGVAAQLLTQHKVSIEGLRGKLSQEQQNKQAGLEDGHKGASIADFTVDLTARAREGKLDPVIGRSTEIERAVHILSRRTKNNPALIGEAGTGKTAIVEGLAQRIVKGTVPPDLARKRILSLDLTSLVAGASKRGEFEERLKLIIKEVQQSAGEIILFIDEMHNIIGTGGGDGTMDAGNILKPYLARGEIQVIGTDTLAEYHRYIEKDPALERRFQPVMVPEPSIEDAIEMIRGLRDKYEAFHKVKISDEALEAAVKLSSRYIGDRFLPDKAVDLIDEAASLKRLPAITLPEEIKNLQTHLLKVEQERAEAEKAGNKIKMVQAQKDLEGIKQKLDELVVTFNKKKGSNTNVVDPSDIEQIVSTWTGIPITRLTESESDKLLHMEDRIHKRLIDQEGAVKAVAEAVRRGRAGLKATKRPIGSFLFLGPTGTGKTEMAKTLAEVLFGSEDLMIRLDMTEYMEKHEVAKLIGAPPGYVGYEEGGQLTEAVRRHPYSVVLLDEVEKAHPDVFNILIQILEDGRLTDNKGRTVSFKNTILICTSNLGSQLITGEDLEEVNVQNIQSMGKSDDKVPKAKDPKAAEANTKFVELTKKLMEELRKFFRPELLNRFDELIVFKPISRSDMLKITEIQLAGTNKLLQEQNMALEVSDAAKKHLAEIGYDPVYGARPLRRLIQSQVETPISMLLIKHEVAEGDTVLLNFQNGEFVFSRKPRPGEQAQGEAVLGAPQMQVNAAGNVLTTEQAKPDQLGTSPQPEGQPVQPAEGQTVVQAPQEPPIAEANPNAVPKPNDGAPTADAQTLGTMMANDQPAADGAAPQPGEAPQEPGFPVDPTKGEPPAAGEAQALPTDTASVQETPGSEAMPPTSDPSAFFENQKAFLDQMASADSSASTPPADGSQPEKSA